MSHYSDISITSGKCVYVVQTVSRSNRQHSEETKEKLLKKVRRIEKRGLETKWRMSKSQDKKITKQLLQNIENSHLYPLAQINKATYINDEKSKILVEFNPETFSTLL